MEPQSFNTLNAQLNPICHLVALLGAHYILHVSRIRVKEHISSISLLDLSYVTGLEKKRKTFKPFFPRNILKCPLGFQATTALTLILLMWRIG